MSNSKQSSMVPAHKQTDPDKKPGQIRNPVTLADYIEQINNSLEIEETFRKDEEMGTVYTREEELLAENTRLRTELAKVTESRNRMDENAAAFADTCNELRAERDAAVLAEREAFVRILETYRVPVGNSPSGELAAEWTMDALRELRDIIRARDND